MPRPAPRKPRFWLLRVSFGLGLLAIFGYSLFTFVEFKQSAVQVSGQVVRVQRESHATGRRGGRVTVDRPVVKFIVPGHQDEVTATAKVLSSQTFSPGEQVALEFLPDQPAATVRIASGLSILEIAFGVVGVAVLFFTLGERWRYEKQVRSQLVLFFALLCSKVL